jgi:hypothetical protein
MPQRASPLPFPHGRDGTVHLVMDCAADRKTVVADLLSGRYRHPLRVVAFDTAESCARDVSAEVARKVLSCAVVLDHERSPAVRDFVERAGP